MAEKWTPEQARATFRNLADTWPKHEMTLTTKREWAKELRDFAPDVVDRAVGRHRRAQLEQAEKERRRDTSWDVPILRDLVEQCRMIIGHTSEESRLQGEWAEKFYEMNLLEQARSWVRQLAADLREDHFETNGERMKCGELLSHWQRREAVEVRCQEREAQTLLDLEARGCGASKGGRLCRQCRWARRGPQPAGVLAEASGGSR
jgi:hypothetical protein